LEVNMKIWLFCIFVATINVQAQLTFFIIGDWGGTSAYPFTTPIQLRVAAAMTAKAQEIRPDFVISVGDNFYDNGILNADDPRFLYTFEQVYTDPALQCEWYITPGNRDYYGNVTGILEYTKKSNRWNITSLNYDYVFDIPNTNAKFHLIEVNTWDMTSSSKNNIGAAPINATRMVESISYISSTLSSSTATWKAVLTHYPIWSAGAHGPFDLDLVNLLEPILLRYKPDFYLAGHDHCLQHLQVNGLDYYIVGSGSDAANNWVGQSGLPANTLRFSYPPQNVDIGGFAVATVNDTFFRIDFYNDQGQLLYTSMQTPQAPSPMEPTVPPQTPVAPPVDNENGTGIPREDPSHFSQVTAVLPESTLFGLVLGIVGGLLVIAGAVLIYLMLTERQKKIDKLQRTQRH